VVQSAGSDALRLTWNANAEPDLAGYKIYGSLTQGGPYTLLNTAALVTATTYLDSDLDGGHTYYYAVTAVDNGGHESNRSNEASGYIAPETDGGTGATTQATPIDWRWALIPAAGFSVLVLLVALLLHGKKKGDKDAEESPSEAATQRENN
jgi:fibronectin type 3 domain-containing protein